MGGRRSVTMSQFGDCFSRNWFVPRDKNMYILHNPNNCCSLNKTTKMSQSLTPKSSLPTPGHRASALQNIFNEALVHTLKTISYENFAACFPTPARACPDSLRAVWQQMIGRFEELARVRKIECALWFIFV